jgi:hypothetical protein
MGASQEKMSTISTISIKSDDTGLFVNQENQKTLLTEMMADYCIDISGSTRGLILENEKKSADKLSEFIKPRKIIGFDDKAHIISKINYLQTYGSTTEPSCFVPLIDKSQCLICYTDGLINQTEMTKFETKINAILNDIPIIIIFVLKDFSITINEMQQTINMSIPEAFLRLSNNVIILITDGLKYKTLMNKGCFSQFETIQLNNDTKLCHLSNFDLQDFTKVYVSGSLPEHMLILNNVVIDLNVLYKLDNVDTIILKSLCDRMHLPRLNLDAMHLLLTRIKRKMNENPLLEQIRDKLADIIKNNEMGTDEHKNLIKQYNLIRLQKNSLEDKEKLNIINKFLEMIANYRANNTSIVLGSNRAIRAVIFDENDLLNLDTCIQIECPIMLDNGDACILMKQPIHANNDYVKNFTSDYAMESPFEFGTWLVDCITPGIFCYDIAQTINTNPYTRDNILGFLPLSTNPTVIMKHMSKLFGGNREMWHMVRGYISMMTNACDKYDWMNKEIILPYIKTLCNNYSATIDLKGGSEKVPLIKSFMNVLTNYERCLRDRTPNDVRAIIKISEVIMPEFKFNKAKITGMINVTDVFHKLLNLHKKGEDMTYYVMEVDDYNHYIKYIGGINGLIAQIFWLDQEIGLYRKLNLQIAINTALNHEKFGSILRKAFIGEEFDDSILELALPEPTGSHFGEEKYKIENKYGYKTIFELPEFVCTFCGKTFNNSMNKYKHLQEMQGKHYYSGYLAVKQAISEIGKYSNERDIFIKTKNILFDRYGKTAGFLHTKRCKNRMLYFINELKASLI